MAGISASDEVSVKTFFSTEHGFPLMVKVSDDNELQWPLRKRSLLVSMRNLHLRHFLHRCLHYVDDSSWSAISYGRRQRLTIRVLCISVFTNKRDLSMKYAFNYSTIFAFVHILILKFVKNYFVPFLRSHDLSFPPDH